MRLSHWPALQPCNDVLPDTDTGRRSITYSCSTTSFILTLAVLAQCPDMSWPQCRLTHNPRLREPRGSASWEVGWRVSRAHCSVSLECLAPVTRLWVAGAGWDALRATDFHIFQSTTPTNPRRSAKRDMYSQDGARSAIGMGDSSWNRAKRGFSLSY